MTGPGHSTAGPDSTRHRARRRARRLGPVLATLTVTGLAGPAAFADPVPTPGASGSSSSATGGSAAPSLGGWTLSASAAPFTMEIYDPKIPIPAMPGKPNLEFDFSYTRASFGSGPSGAATASWLWPGDAVAFGLGTLFNNPNIKYPILTNVQYPGQTPDATMQPIPGSYMQSHTDANGSSAVSTFGLPLPGTGPSPAPAGSASGPAPAATTSPAGFIGGLLPQPQLPDLTSMLKFLGGGPFVDVQGERSQCSTTVAGDHAVASAESDAGKLLILGGLIEFDGLKVTAKTTSDGTKGTAEGVVDYGSMTVAGVTFGITSNGIQTPFGTIALPQLPDAMNQILAPLGISITMPAAGDLSKDAQGEMFSHGMQITIDTAVLKKLLPFTPVLKQLVAQVPPSLTAQLPAQLSQIIQILPDLAPKIVMTVGSAKSAAIASPPIDLSGGATGAPSSAPSSAPATSAAAPAANGTTGGGTGGGTVGGDSSGGTLGGSAATGGATSGGNGSLAPSAPAAAGKADVVAPAAFGGLPGQLTVGALLLACVAAWALRKYSSLLFGGAGCDLGHSTGVPDLREP